MANQLFPILKKSASGARRSGSRALWFIAPVAILCVGAGAVYLMRTRKRRRPSTNGVRTGRSLGIAPTPAPAIGMGKVSSPTFTMPILPVVSPVQNQAPSRSYGPAVVPVVPLPPRRVPGQGKHRRLALVIAAIVSSFALVYAAVGPIRPKGKSSDFAETTTTQSAMFPAPADDAQVTPEVSQSDPIPETAEPAPPTEGPDDALNAASPAPSPETLNAPKKEKHSKKHRTHSRKRSRSAGGEPTARLPAIH